MTPFKKDHSNKKDWILIDAENLSVGRLAAYISMVLRGKNKPTYGKHYDDGDFIVVTNVKKIKFSGKKMLEKKYYKHTGYPGGIKEFTPKELQKRNKSYEILKLAVKRMLPGGPLGKKQLSKLKIYDDDKHPHSANNPKIVDFKILNSKNLVR